MELLEEETFYKTSSSVSCQHINDYLLNQKELFMKNQ